MQCTRRRVVKSPVRDPKHRNETLAVLLGELALELEEEVHKTPWTTTTQSYPYTMQSGKLDDVITRPDGGSNPYFAHPCQAPGVDLKVSLFQRPNGGSKPLFAHPCRAPGVDVKVSLFTRPDGSSNPYFAHPCQAPGVDVKVSLFSALTVVLTLLCASLPGSGSGRECEHVSAP